MTGCCGPSRPASTDAPPDHVTRPAREHRDIVRGMVLIPAGEFRMGSEEPDSFPDDAEGPVRVVELSAFHIDPVCVTNAKFATFVKATGYVTEAERIGWSYVFGGFVHPDAAGDVLAGEVPGAPWWRPVGGATWKAPEGRGSSIGDRQNHPVVHVSWNDAATFAEWSGKRLPTEAEWEKAARGGLDQARYPWGDELTPKGKHRCNIWQGSFPRDNTGEDGFLGTAPVTSFAPNGYGLRNTSGNVWEWCGDRWSTTWHVPETDETRRDPVGPDEGDMRVARGGSYMCHHTYCNRYRVAARTPNTPDSSTGHTGFRCAVSAR